MSQAERIETLLVKEGRPHPGLTVAAIARKAKVPAQSVPKRIYDLKERGNTIYTNFRKVRGQRKTYYRLG